MPSESFIIEGDDFFDMALEDLGRAQRSIFIDMYIFQADEVGWQFHQALLAALDRGIRVAIIYDMIGSLETPDAFWNALEYSGARVYAYHPLWKRQSRAKLHSPGVAGKLLRFWQRIRAAFFRRDHRKILVIDESIGYAGGFNIMRENSRRVVGEARWLDTMYRTEVPEIVAQIKWLFFDSWRRVRAPARELRRESLTRKRVREAIVYPGSLEQGVLRHSPFHLRKQRPPYAHRVTVPRALKRLLLHARSRVTLLYPYFIPYGGMLRHLIRAAKRNCQTSIFLSLASDHPSLNDVAFHIARRLKKHGIQVWLYHGKEREQDAERFAHAKLALVDDDVALGSANLDHRSLALNLETLVVRRNPPFLKEVEELVYTMQAQSIEFKTSMVRRPWRGRLLYYLRRFL